MTKPDAPRCTLAYLTSRKDCLWPWWIESLLKQANGDYSWFEVVVVDFYAEGHKPEDGWTEADALLRCAEFFRHVPSGLRFRHVAPMWGVWQGPHRLTKDNWFAKADYLNAAVCLAEGTMLANSDDLSVLMPGWLNAVREASAWHGVTVGAYRKVRKLEVEDGAVKSYEDHPHGHDNRWKRGSDNGPVSCPPNWMYGYFVAPLEAILKANGWPRYSNSMAYEDTNMGEVLGHQGLPFRYDRRMLAWESEEHHGKEGNMRRADPYRGDAAAKPRDDKSHALKAMAEDPKRTGWPENDFTHDSTGNLSLRQLRAKIQGGLAMPVLTRPTHEPFTGHALPVFDTPEATNTNPNPLPDPSSPCASSPAV
ncbi:hypothetical protein KW797_02985 [Candidatus Parcubacteria bacterium]|nr:hypothetical protein [Candidatus Parcubacteria bacterium]